MGSWPAQSLRVSAVGCHCTARGAPGEAELLLIQHNSSAPIPWNHTHSSPGRGCFLAVNDTCFPSWGSWPSLPLGEAQAQPGQLLHPSPPVWGHKAVIGKAKCTRHGPGEEGSQDCGAQLDKMVCVKLSPATILLSKRMDLEVLSLSREHVFSAREPQQLVLGFCILRNSLHYVETLIVF